MLHEEVKWLPDIKIVGLKEVLRTTDSDKTDPTSKGLGSHDHDIPLQKPETATFSTSSGRRKADERFAEDKFGEELAPESTIWELYQEEAKDFDNEMIDGRNKNLDMMLLFAGLFSAVVTGFLVESKSMLEQDPAEASLTLLLYIAQSQQRLEEGTPRQESPLVDLPPFEVPMHARWVNGLWFLSLGLSLCAALTAMLAKEWLRAFTASRPRSPFEHAILHQRRLKGWRQGYAFHFIDFLPTILHLSLLLFSVGLAVYLWSLDYAIAITIIIVVGVTVAFYLTTAVLASRSPFCPYATQVSSYIRAAFISASMTQSPAVTFWEVLETLEWLGQNALDQITVNCSYQALAGIDALPARVVDPKVTEKNDGCLRPTTFILSQDQHTQLAHMFRGVCQRITEMLDPGYRQLSAVQGISVSRCTGALPHLVELLGKCSIKPAPGRSDALKIWAQTGVQGSPCEFALAALDKAWSNDGPYLTADTYVLLTATELRLVEIAAPRHSPLDAPSDNTNSPPGIKDASSISIQDWSVVESTEFDREAAVVPLFDLRARFSRALFRAALELQYYAEGFVETRTDALVYLLKSIRYGLSCSPLNPTTSMSTHHKQSEYSEAIPIFYSSIAGAGINQFLKSLDIGDEDGLLVGLMRVACSANASESSELAQTAMHTLSVAAPLLLTQWLRLSAESSGGRKLPFIEGALDDIKNLWPECCDISTSTPFDLGVWNMKQLLVIALIAGSCIECQGAQQLSDHTLQLLCKFTGDRMLGQTCAWNAMAECYALVLRLIRLSCVEGNLPGSRALKHLIHWLTITSKLSGTTMIQSARRKRRWHNTDIFHVFLKTWTVVPGLDSELSAIIDQILGGAMSDALESLWSLDGFSLLVDIARCPEYAPKLVKLVARMVSSFLGDDASTHDWEELPHRLTLPYFLQIVGPALSNPPEETPQHVLLSQAFISAAYAFQKRIQAGSITKEVASYDKGVFHLVCHVLQTQSDHSPITLSLLLKYEEYAQIAEDPESWAYMPLRWMFEQDSV